MRKEQFSEAYVKAIAAVAGCAWAKPSVDDDSIDLTLSRRRMPGGGARQAPKLDVQLKCHAADMPADGDDLSFELSPKNYDDLRDPSVCSPRILVIVLVPADIAGWIEQTEAELVLRRCAYWLSLRGLPEGKPSGKTVRLNRGNVFSARALEDIMDRVGRDESP